jgi:transposase
MAAIVFMCRTSTPWALLPVREFGCGSITTCWRRFAEWAAAGVFDRLQELLLDELGAAGLLDWSRVSVDSASVRAVRGGPARRKPGRPRQARVQVAPGRGARWDDPVAAAGSGQPA